MRKQLKGFISQRDWIHLDRILQIVPIRIRRVPARASRDPSEQLLISRNRLCREWLGRRSWADRAAFFVLWPVVVPVSIAIMIWYNGPGCRRRSGVGLMRQVVDQVRLVVTAGIPSPWYYIFDLSEPERQKRARDYLLRSEMKNLFIPTLQTYSVFDIDRSLSDKSIFGQVCEKYGLPVAPTIVVIRDGHFTFHEPAATRLPEEDLFVKQLAGKGGKGAEVWRFVQGRYLSNQGAVLDGESLRCRLEQWSKREDLIVQSCLRNHPEFSDLTTGALSTIRVLSCINENGHPESVAAVLRMPVEPDRAVDNFHAGGIAAGIELRTGTLGPASNLGLFGCIGWVDHHPVTGGQITGRVLHQWEDAQRLATDIHTAMSHFILVGWDIAIAEGGPRLIEGNQVPCVDLMQRPLREPIGCGRLAEMLEFHFDRAQRGLGPPLAA